MRHFNFKINEEIDGDIIKWLDSFGPGRERSTRIRDALRFYRQSKMNLPAGVTSDVTPIERRN